MKTPFDDEKLELNYPCLWTYTVIGAEEVRLKEAILSILGTRKYSLVFSHTSTGGKYCSFHLELTVSSDEDRLGLFEALRMHGEVRYVL